MTQPHDNAAAASDRDLFTGRLIESASAEDLYSRLMTRVDDRTGGAAVLLVGGIRFDGIQKNSATWRISMSTRT